MAQPPVHRTILVVDVEGFGTRQRTNQNQVAVRNGLYRVLERAFGEASIPWAACDREDRGDGVFVLAPPGVHKVRFVESLPHKLVEALSAHNDTHPEAERIRLRMALHAGEVNYDDHGVTAAAINLAFRLLDARPLKDALTKSAGPLGLIISEWFFDEVVRHSSASDPASYRRVELVAKETIATAWIRLLGQSHSSRESLATATGSVLVAVPITSIQTKEIFSLAFSHDGHSLAVATGTSTVRVFDTTSWRQRLAVRQHWLGQASVFTVAFSPLGYEVATGGSVAGGGMVQLSYADTGSRSRKIAHGAAVWSVAFDAGGAWLATGDSDGNVRILTLSRARN